MRINTNVSAINAHRNLTQTQNALGLSMQKLSSGFRINRAADDAAGLGIANILRASTRALQQAARNAEQANSVLQIAEGATGTIQKMLERMKELATQAGSDSVDTDGRTRIQAEFVELRSEIARTVDTTKFQGGYLLQTVAAAAATAPTATAAGAAVPGDYTVTNANFDISVDGGAAQTITLDGNYADADALATGINTKLTAAGITTVSVANNAGTLTWTHSTAGAGSSFTVTDTDGALGGDVSATGTDAVEASGGARSFMISSSGSYSTHDLVTINAIDLTVTTLGIDADDLSTTGGAQTALTNIDAAMEVVNTVIGDIGAAQNRIAYALDNVKTTVQNFAAAESVIRDVDMAEEMTTFSKNNILAQAGTAMLAQANQSAQTVLQLLRG